MVGHQWCLEPWMFGQQLECLSITAPAPAHSAPSLLAPPPPLPSPCMLTQGFAHHRLAEEPLISAILNSSASFTRAHAITLLKRWFCISLGNNIAVQGIARRHFEGVMLDVQTEEMTEAEAETWADDDAVVKWIIQFTGHGTTSNIFEREVDVSHYILSFTCRSPRLTVGLCLSCVLAGCLCSFAAIPLKWHPQGACAR